MPHDARIQRLSTEVINRIAAGEVVQRPSAALKELIENSLDAGCTCIQVVAQEGGLDTLQVSDDGCGIPFDDLPLLCERYATSKLRKFEDLQRISSFGFRGEALAALSFVSRVTATTRYRGRGEEKEGEERRGREHPSLAWRARYLDGCLVGRPEPCAANHGTTIRAEKMFYNATVRRAALRPVEEWSRLVEVVSRYALAFPAVGFVCRKETPSKTGDGVSFPKGSSTLNNVRLSHGSSVASSLRFIFYYVEELYEASKKPARAFSDGEPQDSVMGSTHGEGVVSSDATASSSSAMMRETPEPSNDRKQQEREQAMKRVRKVSEYVATLSGSLGEGVFTIMGYTSDSSLLSRKGYFCLFVNQRLVESVAIRRAIETVYGSALTGGNRPFTVLFVSVPPDRVDVNVHPTKTEVYLLDEELVTARVAELVRGALLEGAAARQLDVRTLGRPTTLALQAATRAADAADAAGLPASNSAQLSPSQAVLQALERGLLQPAGGGVGGTAPGAVVRVEPQRGALDAFLRSQSTARGGERTAAAATESLSPSGGGSAPLSYTLLVDSRPGPDASHFAVSTDEEETSAMLGPSPDGESKLRQIRFGESKNSNSDDDEDGDEIMLEFKKFRQELSTQEVCATASPLLFTTQTEVSGHEECEHLQEGEETQDQHAKTSSLGRGNDLGASSRSPLSAAGQFDNRQSRPFLCGEVDQNTVAGSKPMGNDIAMEDAVGAASSQVAIAPELEDHVLTSVSVIAKEICSQSSPAAQSLVDGLSFVGMVDEDCFLAQFNTTLLLVRLLPLVREVVYQRIFLRWVQSSLPNSPLLSFGKPILVRESLLFALHHDALGMASPSREFLELLRLCVTNGCGTVRGPTGCVENSSTEWLALIDRVSSREEDKHRARLEDYNIAQCGSAQLTSSTEEKRPFQRDTGNETKHHDEDSHYEVEALMTVAPSFLCGSAQAQLATEKYICRLVRRLSFWRDMLCDYFGIVFTDDAEHLLSLPYGLNASWSPLLRAVPLFMWLLADAVPYPSLDAPRSNDATQRGNSPSKSHFFYQEREVDAEIRCFTSIARHIADTLYGLMVPVDEDLDSKGAFSTTNGVQAVGGRDSCAPRSSSQLCSPTSTPHVATGMHGDAKNAQGASSVSLDRLGDRIRFGLFPCIRNKKLYIPPADLLTRGDMQSVVTVETLYKVFERC